MADEEIKTHYKAKLLRSATEAQRFMRALNRGSRKYSTNDLLDDVDHCRWALEELRREVTGPLDMKTTCRFNGLLRILSVIEIAICGLSGADYGDGINAGLVNRGKAPMLKPIKMPELPLGRRRVSIKKLPALGGHDSLKMKTL